MYASSALATQQLAEFLAHISTFRDPAAATAAAAERAARLLEAEVGAVVDGDEVVAAVGFASGAVPADLLVSAATQRPSYVEITGLGSCALVTAPIDAERPCTLLVARSGDDAFTVDEISLARGMARSLALMVDTLRTFEAERAQAAKNAVLLAEVQERQRLLEQLGTIQRAIARRAPLQHILDTTTSAAQSLLGDEVVILRMLDPDDPNCLLIVSSTGLSDTLAAELWRLPVADCGAPGQAVTLDELVVIDDYAESADRVRALHEDNIRTVMAAPVHDNGKVVGALHVASRDDDRVFSTRDREVLLAFAEHVSLAVTDANTVEAMYQAFHDSLTGLASRALFLDRLTHGLACAAREQTRVAVLFVDLDRFKIVNDTLGHAAGDMLLVGVADRLRSCIRAADTVGRFGGDEFAIILHDVVRPDQAAVVADRIIASLKQPFILSGKEVFVGASVGIAFSDPKDDAEAVIQHADVAMYQAKNLGKGRYEVFEPSMAASLSLRRDLEADLRHALARAEFILHFQPVVELPSGRIVGVEALVRWEHPRRGLVPPLDFIPLAEQTGLIVPIGEWVLEAACAQAARWNLLRPGNPLSLSVNLSGVQLHQPDLAEVVRGVLEDTGLDPACLVLEITESILVQDAEGASTRLRALKDLGARLAIDDFGTGYSSLAYLRRFPVDILKIDKAFIDDVACDEDAAALVASIVGLGSALRLSLVAEGIESADQRDRLAEVGCGSGQGYFFARPLTAEAIGEMIESELVRRHAS